MARLRRSPRASTSCSVRKGATEEAGAEGGASAAPPAESAAAKALAKLALPVPGVEAVRRSWAGVGL